MADVWRMYGTGAWTIAGLALEFRVDLQGAPRFTRCWSAREAVEPQEQLPFLAAKFGIKRLAKVEDKIERKKKSKARQYNKQYPGGLIYFGAKRLPLLKDNRKDKPEVRRYNKQYPGEFIYFGAKRLPLLKDNRKKKAEVRPYNKQYPGELIYFGAKRLPLLKDNRKKKSKAQRYNKQYPGEFIYFGAKRLPLLKDNRKDKPEARQYNKQYPGEFIYFGAKRLPLLKDNRKDKPCDYLFARWMTSLANYTPASTPINPILGSRILANRAGGLSLYA